MESFRAPTAWADLDGVENDDLEAKLRATGSQAVLVNYALIAFWSSSNITSDHGVYGVYRQTT